MPTNRISETRKKILIVDDDLDVRIYVRTLFETSGYAPVVTRNGIEGLLKAKEILPDLIILDVMMPEAGGVTMLNIKVKNPIPPPDAHLEKPLDHEKLLSLAKKLIV